MSNQAESIVNQTGVLQELIDSKELMARYRIVNYQTLARWRKRAENPLPEPIAGGKRAPYVWRVSDIVQWENTCRESV